MPLFDRSCTVLVDIDDEQTVINGVRISFECEKTSTSTKNSASIKIYNLAETTRDIINTEEAAITLMAGYLQDVGEEILFKGDVVFTKTNFISPDLITEIELKDGGNALRDARLNRSFKAGTSAQDIVQALADETKLTIKEITADLKDSYANGVSVTGLVSESLTKILKKFGIDWTVTDGELQVIDKDTANSDTAIILNPSTGLVGLPAFLIDDKNELPDAQNPNKKLKLTSLLIPSINPTRKLKIESRIVDGLYVVDNVTHTGDTHGDKWLSSIEATAL